MLVSYSGGVARLRIGRRPPSLIGLVLWVWVLRDVDCFGAGLRGLLPTWGGWLFKFECELRCLPLFLAALFVSDRGGAVSF